MSAELIKYGFVAGELAGNLHGRTDLAKYDLGMALAYNWDVDYSGGLVSRPGFEMGDIIKRGDLTTKFFRFQFSPNIADTYVLLFGHNYIRFIQDNAYVLEAQPANPISAISIASTAVFSQTAHGFTTGQWLKLPNMPGMPELSFRTIEVVSTGANTFTALDLIRGTPLSTVGFGAYTGGAYPRRIYEIVSPYAASDLEDLSGEQGKNLVRLTNKNFPIYNLVRNDHTNWTLSTEQIGQFTAPPTGLTLVTTGAAGLASTAYAVAAIMADDQGETSPSLQKRAVNFINFTTYEGQITVKWDPVPGAEAYVVYRTFVTAIGDPVPGGMQLGFLGTTKGTQLSDSNIIPDFTKGPTKQYNPFAPGAIKSLTVTAPGTGYSFIVPITATGTGTGFSGYAIADSSGAITSAVIINAGINYGPGTTFAVAPQGGASGATVSGTVDALTGTYPSQSIIFQQRQVYAASINHPLTIWGSQIKRYSNFDESEVQIDSDSYEFEIDSTQVAEIRHLIATRGGLLAMSMTGIWLLTGQPAGGAVTPTNALADLQTYTGVSKVKPIPVAQDILHIEGRGYSVRLLSYNDYSKVYTGEDKSLLSNHLFGKDKEIIRWAFADNPKKIVRSVRSDGALLSFTIVKEQDVYAWTWGKTKGKFKDIIAVQETGYDRVYVSVQRPIYDRTVTFFERLAVNDFTNVEDAWCVDAGLKIEPPAINAALTFSVITVDDDGVRRVTLGATGQFTGRAGQWIRAAGGIFAIESVTADTAVCIIISSPTDVIAEDPLNRIYSQAALSWTMGPKQTEFYGFWHLEGEDIAVLGDGNVMLLAHVTNGKITIEAGSTKIIAGIPYRCIAKTLPPAAQQAAIEGRKKRPVRIGVRMKDTRGLLVGKTDLEKDLYPIKERTVDDAYGNATKVIANGIEYYVPASDWTKEAQVYFVQNSPLPATLLALLLDMEIGDDPD